MYTHTHTYRYKKRREMSKAAWETIDGETKSPTKKALVEDHIWFQISLCPLTKPSYETL